MELDDIKRGLRAEINKRENEQYATFQCNVRQMCKDVLAKLEEQEQVIEELKEKRQIGELKDKWFWAYPTESVNCDGITGSAHQVYPKDEVDEIISTVQAERDEYRYNLSCARNEIHNMQMSMRADVKKNTEKDGEIVKLKSKVDKLLGCLKYLVMRDLIKDCPPKKTAAEIVQECEE